MTSAGNLLHLFLLAYVMFIIGAFLNIIGTTLPDLQCLFHSDLQTVSRLFLAAGIPMNAVSVLSSHLLKKWNLYLLLAAAMFLYSGSISLVVSTGIFQVAITALMLTGIAIGLGINSTLYMCNLLYPKSAYAFHVLSAAVSTGSLLCPIIAKPFLGEIQPIDGADASVNVKETALMSEVMSSSPSYSQLPFISNTSLNNSLYCQTTKSSVQYLYIIFSLIAFPVALSFSICYLSSKCQSKDIFQSQTDQYIDLGEKKSKVEVSFSVLLVLSFPCPYGLAYTYGSYITTLGITGSLHLGVQRMAFLASMFWLSFLVGRLTAIVGSFFTKQVVILYICLIGQIASIIVLIVTDGTKEMFMWIGSLSLAFFTGPQFAALAAWSRYYIFWTPLVVGLMAMADNIGVTFLPYVSGQLMGSYGEEWQLYYCLGLAVFEFIVFCTLHFLGRHMGEVKERKAEHK